MAEVEEEGSDCRSIVAVQERKYFKKENHQRVMAMAGSMGWLLVLVVLWPVSKALRTDEGQNTHESLVRSRGRRGCPFSVNLN